MGYTAQALADALAPRGVAITGTTRSRDKADRLRDRGIEPRLFPGDDLAEDVAHATHILSTIGPSDGADPVLADLRDLVAQHAGTLDWVGYLSTTGVYGDHAGQWVTEDTPVTPGTDRGHARAAAEAGWQALHREHGLPTHIFRLPGIYGPGRSPLDRVRSASARRIIKPGQVFSRIHVEDIAQALIASMDAPNPGAIYNIADDEPAPPQDVLAYAADILEVPRPPEVAFDAADLSPMARSFYAESKRVDNSRMRTELGVHLRYPTYREGLDALLAAEAAK
jgi:nucleoside-diphosphate-sugar epimerase